MKQLLTWQNIGELATGNAGAAINAAINKAVADLEDRGQEDGLPREVTVKLTFRRKSGLVVTDVQVKSKIPPYQTGLTACNLVHRQSKLGPTPMLQFQDAAADNPDQSTLDEHTRE